MMIVRTMVLFAPLALAVAVPAYAAGKTDALAACMWEQKPTTTAAFAETDDDFKGFSLFVKAVADCHAKPGNFNLSSVRKKVIATRPAVIGPDKVGEAQAFVCPKGADGIATDCKAAGE
jgi:hypothetical protein